MIDDFEFVRICASGNKNGVADLIGQSKENESTPNHGKILHGKTPIEIAACFGRLNVVEELVKYGGIEVNQTSESGKKQSVFVFF